MTPESPSIMPQPNLPLRDSNPHARHQRRSIKTRTNPRVQFIIKIEFIASRLYLHSVIFYPAPRFVLQRGEFQVVRGDDPGSFIPN